MNFDEALKKLGIEKYSKRIFNSNSHGELFHIQQYSDLAEAIIDPSWFSEWFDCIVDYAENNWERPESVFQHIVKILDDEIKESKIKLNEI